jgi:hypothetical protein
MTTLADYINNAAPEDYRSLYRVTTEILDISDKQGRLSDINYSKALEIISVARNPITTSNLLEKSFLNDDEKLEQIGRILESGENGFKMVEEFTKRSGLAPTMQILNNVKGKFTTKVQQERDLLDSYDLSNVQKRGPPNKHAKKN